MPDILYIDSSVAIHVIAGTPGAPQWFNARLTAGDRVVSSRLLDVEIVRYLRREQLDLTLADDLRDSLSYLSMDDALLREAAAIEPALTTLDCLHLASAARIGAGLTTVVTHDAAVTRVARRMGFTTHDPVG